MFSGGSAAVAIHREAAAAARTMLCAVLAVVAAAAVVIIVVAVGVVVHHRRHIPHFNAAATARIDESCVLRDGDRADLWREKKRVRYKMSGDTGVSHGESGQFLALTLTGFSELEPTFWLRL